MPTKKTTAKFAITLATGEVVTTKSTRALVAATVIVADNGESHVLCWHNSIARAKHVAADEPNHPWWVNKFAHDGVDGYRVDVVEL